MINSARELLELIDLVRNAGKGEPEKLGHLVSPPNPTHPPCRVPNNSREILSMDS